MRTGFPAKYVVDIAKTLGIPRDELYKALRFSQAGTEARLDSNRPLDALGTDRLYRLVRLVTRAADVFEDEAAAIVWVLGENRAFGGVAPITVLDTEYGYEMALNMLERIVHGVYS